MAGICERRVYHAPVIETSTDTPGVSQGILRVECASLRLSFNQLVQPIRLTMKGNRRDVFRFLAASTALAPQMRAWAQQLADGSGLGSSGLGEAAPLQATDFEQMRAAATESGALGLLLSTGADDDLTLAANVQAFKRIGLMPRVLVDVSRWTPAQRSLEKRGRRLCSCARSAANWPLRRRRDSRLHVRRAQRVTRSSCPTRPGTLSRMSRASSGSLHGSRSSWPQVDGHRNARPPD